MDPTRIPAGVFAVAPIAMLIFAALGGTATWALIILAVLAVAGVALEVYRVRITRQVRR